MPTTGPGMREQKQLVDHVIVKVVFNAHHRAKPETQQKKSVDNLIVKVVFNAHHRARPETQQETLNS